MKKTINIYYRNVSWVKRKCWYQVEETNFQESPFCSPSDNVMSLGSIACALGLETAPLPTRQSDSRCHLCICPGIPPPSWWQSYLLVQALINFCVTGWEKRQKRCYLSDSGATWRLFPVATVLPSLPFQLLHSLSSDVVFILISFIPTLAWKQKRNAHVLLTGTQY